MEKNKAILATGADIKNRFLFVRNNRLYFGPDIGNLGEARNYEFFKKEIEKATRKIKPSIIAYDMHPGYFSTQFAKNYSPQPTPHSPQPIQHHHAHIASVMQEYNLEKPVIGVSFDGTGFGADGNMWGGEFLLAGKNGFKRLAHFKYVKMPGGDKVVSEPWRMVISMLGQKAVPFLRDIKKEDKNITMLMMAKNINSPLTSSAGRIFDTAAALLGICKFASYEAEGPIKLESMCKDDIGKSYDFTVSKYDNKYIIDVRPAFLEMLEDLKKGITKRVIAIKFHNAMVNIIVKTVKKLSSNTGIKKIVLSGGVFQNRFLKRKVIKKLLSMKFNIFSNNKTPVNDYNISLGQYYVLRYNR